MIINMRWDSYGSKIPLFQYSVVSLPKQNFIYQKNIVKIKYNQTKELTISIQQFYWNPIQIDLSNVRHSEHWHLLKFTKATILNEVLKDAKFINHIT